MEVVSGTQGHPVLGGVLHMSNGDWLLGYYGSAGFSNSLHMELLALYHMGCEWLGSMVTKISFVTLTHLWLSIWFIGKPMSGIDHYAAIKELLARNWRVRVIHMLRVAYSVADYLAKQGAIQNAAWVELLDPPTEVSQLFAIRCQ